MLSTTLPQTTDPILYTCQVHAPDGRILTTLALVSGVTDPVYQVQHPERLHWLAIPSSLVTLGGRVDMRQPRQGQTASTDAWEYHQTDGWAYHPTPAAMPEPDDVLLRAAYARACAAYPAEQQLILRGYQIALADGVTLLADGTAIVASQSHPGEMYRVNGHCTCRDAKIAPEGRCKHRWSKSLATWARR